MAANGLMFLDLSQIHDSWTERALNLKRIDDFLDDSGGTSNLDVLVAHWTISIQQKPILNTQLTEKLITVVTLLRIPRQLYK